MDTSILDTKKAVESYFASQMPSYTIAYENVNFTPPDGLYLDTQFIFSNPFDPVFGTGYHREIITFVVYVVGKKNSGSGLALQTAGIVRDKFKKGTLLTLGMAKIQVLKTPHISTPVQMNTNFAIPVYIELFVEVFE